MSDKLAIGARARQILESEEWKDAWKRYRDRIIEQMERAASNDTELVMHLKRMMTSADCARAALEEMIMEGRMVEHNIELEREAVARRTGRGIAPH